MRRLLAVALMGALMAGCGGSTRQRPGDGRTPTQPQILELARVLLNDYNHSGSRLTGTYTVDGQLLDFVGNVDFRNAAGTLSLHQRSLPGQSARTYFWTRKLVLAQTAPGSDAYLARPPDPQNNFVDHLIAFIDLLSSPAIDNIELLQSSGVRYLGSSRGVDRFREGKRVVLSVEHSSDLLSAVQATETGGSTISVLLLSHAPQRIRLPPRSRWRRS